MSQARIFNVRLNHFQHNTHHRHEEAKKLLFRNKIIYHTGSSGSVFHSFLMPLLHVSFILVPVSVFTSYKIHSFKHGNGNNFQAEEKNVGCVSVIYLYLLGCYCVCVCIMTIGERGSNRRENGRWKGGEVSKRERERERDREQGKPPNEIIIVVPINECTPGRMWPW